MPEFKIETENVVWCSVYEADKLFQF